MKKHKRSQKKVRKESNQGQSPQPLRKEKRRDLMRNQQTLKQGSRYLKYIMIKILASITSNR
jgi:hypothetical protein